MRYGVHGPRALLCATLLACSCSSADGPSAAPAGPSVVLTVSATESAPPSSVMPSSAAAVASVASPEDQDAEREVNVPAAIPAVAAQRHEARCTETRSVPSSSGTHSLLVDRGDSRERWYLSDSSPGEGSLERESIDVGGSVFLRREFQFTSLAASLRSEWTQHFDAKRRLVGVELDGQRWLQILAWDGEVPDGFQSLVDQAPFGFDAMVAEDLTQLFTELEARHHQIAVLTSGTSKVWSAYGHAGVQIHFDRGRPSLWDYSPVSRTVLCAYEWSGTRLTKVRCAEGNDTDPPPEGLPPGSEDFSWTLHWEGSRLAGLSHRGRAGALDVRVKLDAKGRIVELSNAKEQRRLVITRDPEGRVVREEAWLQGNNHATTTTRYSCPAVLPKLPPLAPP